MSQISIFANAQVTKIRGKVLAAETSEPVPFVNVAFSGTSIGTITDFNGEFNIETRTPGDTLVISFVGFKTQKVAIRKNVYQELNIELESESYALEEVIVTPGENPAHPILRSIIANKENNNLRDLGSYKTSLYNKVQIDINNVDDEFKNRKVFNQFQFVFDYVDTSSLSGKPYLPVFISESVSDYYYRDKPKLEKEVIKASQISGIENESVSQFTGKMYQKLNIYDNFITIFEPGFVSPIADFGLLYYKYYLIDSSFIDNTWCYHISFKPKRKQERTFTGDFWVADTSFAIKSFKMRMARDANINFINDLVSEQEFSLVNDSIWMLTKESLLVDFNLSDRATGFFGRKTTGYSNFEFGIDIPEDIEELSTNTYVEPAALKKPDEFWELSRPFALTDKEKGVYEMVDSIQNVPVFRTFVDVVNLFVNYYYVVGWFEIGPYYKTYSFNEIEGNRFRISGRTSNDFSTKLMLSGFAAYGDKDNRFKYGTGALYMFNKNPRMAAGISYKHDIEQLGQSPNALTEDNILTSLLRRNPNYKLLMVDEFNTYIEKEWFQGFSNTLRFNYKTLHPTEYIPFEVISEQGNYFLSNLTISSFNLNTRFAKDEKFLLGEFERVSLGSDKPIFNLDLTGGIEGVLGNDYTFAKVHFNMQHKLELNPFGLLRYRIDAGKIFGEIPYPLLQLHEGNETYAFDRYAFNMMNYYEFASDTYASIWLEHHFNGFFFNRVPLFRKLKWREVVSAKGLMGDISNRNLQVMEFPLGLTDVNKPYAEVSVGVENIFKVIRVDAMWRLSYLDHENIEIFGIRAMLQIIL